MNQIVQKCLAIMRSAGPRSLLVKAWGVLGGGAGVGVAAWLAGKGFHRFDQLAQNLAISRLVSRNPAKAEQLHELVAAIKTRPERTIAAPAHLLEFLRRIRPVAFRGIDVAGFDRISAETLPGSLLIYEQGIQVKTMVDLARAGGVHVVWNRGPLYLLAVRADSAWQAADEAFHRQIQTWIRDAGQDSFTHASGCRFSVRPWTRDREIVAEVYENYMPWLKGKDLTGCRVIDVGAHIGSFAVMAAKLFGASVEAYEPRPDSYRLLCKNLEQNQPLTAQAFSQAVSNHRGVATLYLSADTGGNRLHVPPVDTSAAVTVPAVTLSDILSSASGPAEVLKMDIEGLEYLVLFPARTLLQQRVKTIILETHNSRWGHVRDMVRFLTKSGFNLQRRGDNHLSLLVAENPLL